jgi:hypothetical protein
LGLADISLPKMRYMTATEEVSNQRSDDPGSLK